MFRPQAPGPVLTPRAPAPTPGTMHDPAELRKARAVVLGAPTAAAAQGPIRDPPLQQRSREDLLNELD